MKYSKPIIEIIKQRFSCRNYKNQPIDPQKRQLLQQYMDICTNGPFGTPARFKLVAATAQDHQALKGLGTYGFIRGATGFILGAAEQGPKNLEDWAYLMERIVLYATDLGLGTCWLGGTFTRSSFSTKISIGETECMPAVCAVGHIAQKRRLVDAIIRARARSDKRLPWERLFFDGHLGNPLSREQAGAYATPLDMVRLGPSASNKQPWRLIKEGPTWHLYLQRSKGYDRFHDLLQVADIQRIDMGIAMCHFELSANELGLAGQWQIQDPAITAPDEQTTYIASWQGSVPNQSA